jgi:ATP-dependent helicase/nuclease subunit A
MAKADAYSKHRGGELITLAANFRSRKEVLRDINRLFERLMDQAVGGADYGDGHALDFGNRAYEDEPKTASIRGLSFLSYSVSEDEAAIQVEADSIARHIRGLIDSGYAVHDWRNGGLRPLAHGDIAIIADRKSAFLAYREALTKAGVPVRVRADETFVAAAEIQTAAHVLRLIRLYGLDRFDEDEFRRAFYGTARSYALRIEDDAVLTLFAAQRFQNRDDLSALSLHPTFAALDRTLRELAQLAKTRSVAELYEETAARFDLLGKTALLPDPRDAEAKLLYLQAKLASLEAFDLESAIRYFEAIEDSDDLDIDYVKAWDDDADAVTVLTMHKAKGLEFPICYFPGLDKRFHTPETREFFQFDPTYGLFAKAYRNGFHDTPLHVLLEAKRRALDRSERMRLLYVALTRVKEAGFLLLNEALLDKIAREPVLRPAAPRLQANKFSDWTTHFAGELIPIYQAERGQWRLPTRPKEANANAAPIVFRSLSFPTSELPARTYSAKTRLVDAPDRALSFGESLHEMLRGIDWHAPDTTGLNETERAVVKRISVLKVLGLPDAKHYHEVPLMDEADRMAIIDLIVETDDELRVVDFKTQSIDHPEYRTQVANYCKLLRSRTTKRVSGTLISLLTGDTLPVEVEDDSSGSGS